MSRWTIPILYVLTCLVVASVSGAAQELVDVRLTQPPPNQLRVADLWKVELNNRGRTTVRVRLHGTVEETSVPDGIIADATTRIIVLEPGRKVVTGADVQPVSIDQANARYRDALLQTGNVPTGDYTVCCEVISAETEQILGRDCKFIVINRMSQPVLISPPDESDIQEKLPVFTWMASVPPGPGQRIAYNLRIVEIFGKQTPADAMARNPAWFEANSLTRMLLQYPISSRAFEYDRTYAWKITAVEDRGGRALINLGESEIWSFTPRRPERGEEDTAGNGAGGGAKPPVTKADETCPGENWDFELTSLACWTLDGDAFQRGPQSGAHPVLGELGHHRERWVTSYGDVQGDAMMGVMYSEEFQIKNSAVGFIYGGTAANDVAVELLVERLPKDTFKLETRRLPESQREYYVAKSTAMDKKAAMSDRLAPVEWDVTRFINRAARVYIKDQSKTGHLNVDNFRFYDLEKGDSVKLPVLVMAAGEKHSLSATPDEKPPKSIRDQFTKDITDLKTSRAAISDVQVVNQTSTSIKGRLSTVAQMSQFAAAETIPENTQVPEISGVEYSPQVMSQMKLFALTLLDPKNTVWGWGNNYKRAVAKAYGAIVQSPSKLDATKVKDVQALAAGMAQSFAVIKGGNVKGWGLNDYGQIGNNTRTDVAEPTQIQLTNILAVSTGARHSAAISTTGDVWMWGYNRNGELGTWLTQSFNATTGQVDGVLHVLKPFRHFVLRGARSVACGGAHTASATLAGEVYCWGANTYGQCGGDPDEGSITWPSKIVFPVQRPQITNVSCGDFHTLALGANGSVWAWGGNASGQLGDGTTKDRTQAVQVKGLKGIKAIAAGSTFSLALDSTGAVWAWGNNSVGQLGDGTRVGRREPVKVSRLDAVTGIVAGGAHAMAVRIDGGLWTWGTNEYGQLGEGDVVNLAPTPADPPIGPLRVERLAAP